MVKLVLLIFLTIISNKISAVSIGSNFSVYRLQSHLLDGYNRAIRPVSNHKTITIVNLDFTLFQIISMDDQHEAITISGYLNIVKSIIYLINNSLYLHVNTVLICYQTKEWNDEILIWNPNEESQIEELMIPSNQLWVPDVFLYNAADQNSWNPLSVENILVRVKNNGTCQLYAPILVTTYCNLDISNFPFDEKSCYLNFGSWSHTKDYIEIKSQYNVDTSNYYKNSAWSLESSKQFIQLIKYSQDSYVISTIKLGLKRRTLFFSFNFILPSIVITICSIFGFILPPDCGEKIGLQITNLLGVVFLLQYVSTIVPQSSMGVAKISIYFFSTSVLCMFSLIANVIVLNLHEKDIRIQKEMPKWFESLVCVHLARFFRMKEMKFNNKSNNEKSEYCVSICSLLEDRTNRNFSRNSSLIKKVTNIENRLNAIWNEMTNKATEEEKELKWKYAANVMDRLFLSISLTYFLVTFISIILTIRNLY